MPVRHAVDVVIQLEAWELLGVENTDKCKVFASPHGSRKGNVT
jgi:hypothetical protein